MSRHKRALQGLMLVLCLLLGIILALQFRSQHQGISIPLVGKSVAELQTQLANLEEENQELRLDIAEQRQQLRELLTAREGVDSQESVLRRELDRAKTYAGLTAVEGPGAIVTVEGSPTATLLAPEILVILNEFRGAGAQGLSLNGQRIVAMTEVRSVGTSGRDMMVNGERIAADGLFELRIIGEHQSLENAWAMLARFRRNMEDREITMSIQYPEIVRLPALPEHSPAYRIAYLQQSPVGEGTRP